MLSVIVGVAILAAVVGIIYGAVVAHRHAKDITDELESDLRMYHDAIVHVMSGEPKSLVNIANSVCDDAVMQKKIMDVVRALQEQCDILWEEYN